MFECEDDDQPETTADERNCALKVSSTRPLHVFQNERTGHWSAGLHTFGDNMRCEWCDIPWKAHQRYHLQCQEERRRKPTNEKNKKPVQKYRQRADRGPIEAKIGERIREARHDAKMTQTKLGELVGLSFTQISYYETGARLPIRSVVERMARVLNVKIGWLYSGKVAKAPFKYRKKNEIYAAFQNS